MSNLLAIAGFAVMLVAVGLITDYRWSLLGLGPVLLLAAYAAHTAEAAIAPAADVEDGEQLRRVA